MRIFKIEIKEYPRILLLIVLSIGIVYGVVKIYKSNAQSEPSTVTISDKVYSNESHIGKNIIVEAGGKFVISGKSILANPNSTTETKPLELNNLTIKSNGIVTHPAAGSNGTILTSNSALTEWSGIWKPVTVRSGFFGNGEKYFSQQGLCFNWGTTDVEIESAEGKTWKSVPQWFNKGPYSIGVKYICYFGGLDLNNTDKETYTIRFKTRISLFDEPDEWWVGGKISIAPFRMTSPVSAEFTHSAPNFYPSDGDVRSKSNRYFLNASYNQVPDLGNGFTKLDFFGNKDKVVDDNFYCPKPSSFNHNTSLPDKFADDCNPITENDAYSIDLGQIDAPGWSIQPQVYLKIAGTLKIEPNAGIDVSGKGYPGTTGKVEGKDQDGYGPAGGVGGTDSGSCDDWSAGGAGGHGGKGRVPYGDGYQYAPPLQKNPYGSVENPITYGSGGAGSSDEDDHVFSCDTEKGTGGTGGGSIHVIANRIEIDKGNGFAGYEGKILARGTDGFGGGKPRGGGAGGSIWLETNELVNGNTGWINVNPGTESDGRDGQYGTAYFENRLPGSEAVAKCLNSPTNCIGDKNLLKVGDNIQAYGGASGGGGGRIAIYYGIIDEPPPPPPPTEISAYTVEKTLSPDSPIQAGQSVKPGDKIKYKIKITKSDISPVSCNANPVAEEVDQRVVFNATGGDNSYEWVIPGATFVSDANKSPVTVMFKQPGTYPATVTSGSQTGTCSVLITRVSPDPTVNNSLYSLDIVNGDDGKEYIYAAGGKGLVIKTSDGGNTWENKSITIPDNNVTLWSIDAVDKNIVWAGGWKVIAGGAVSPLVYRSLDGGSTWELKSFSVPDNEVMRVSATSKDNAWVESWAPLKDKIYWTNNGGDSWADRGATSEYYGSGLSAVDANKAVRAYPSGTTSELYLTSNGGTNWSEVLSISAGYIYENGLYVTMFPDSSGITTSRIAKNKYVDSKNVKMRFWSSLDGSQWDEKTPLEVPEHTLFSITGLDKYQSGADNAGWVAGLLMSCPSPSSPDCSSKGWLVAKTRDQATSWSVNHTDVSKDDPNWKYFADLDANELDSAWLVGTEYLNGGGQRHGVIGKATTENGLGTTKIETGIGGVYFYK